MSETTTTTEVDIQLAPLTLVFLTECSPDDEPELRRRLKLLDALGPMLKTGPMTDAQLDALVKEGRRVRARTTPFLEWASRQLAGDTMTALTDGIPRLISTFRDLHDTTPEQLEALADAIHPQLVMLRDEAMTRRMYRSEDDADVLAVTTIDIDLGASR